MEKVTPEKMDGRIEALKETRKKAVKSPRIGKRGKGKKTLLQEEAHEEYKQKIIKNLPEITEAQMALAKGQTVMMARRWEKDKKGKLHRTGKWYRVTRDSEIIDLLNGTQTGDEYYFITTEKPDNRAIDSALDRTIGKPKEKMEVSGEGGGPVELDVRILDAMKHSKKKHDRENEQ